MIKKFRKRTVIAVVVAVMMVSVSVVAYAASFNGTCGHGYRAWGSLTKTNTTATATTSTSDHTNSTPSISVSMTVKWISSNGSINTSPGTVTGSATSKTAKFTVPSGKILSVTSEHGACDNTFSLSE